MYVCIRHTKYFERWIYFQTLLEYNFVYNDVRASEQSAFVQ